jgi:hypothetical protein
MVVIISHMCMHKILVQTKKCIKCLNKLIWKFDMFVGMIISYTSILHSELKISTLIN